VCVLVDNHFHGPFSKSNKQTPEKEGNLIIGRIATNNERGELLQFSWGAASGYCYQAFSLFIPCLSCV